MTTFKQPVFVGDNSGNITTATRGYVTVIKEVDVSAGNRTVTRTLADNSGINRIQVVVASAVAGIAAGVTLRAGTVASPDLYGTIGVSAEGVYDMVLTKQIINNPTTVIIDATAQASAANWTALKTQTRIIYGSRS